MVYSRINYWNRPTWVFGVGTIGNWLQLAACFIIFIQIFYDFRWHSEGIHVGVQIKVQVTWFPSFKQDWTPCKTVPKTQNVASSNAEPKLGTFALWKSYISWYMENQLICHNKRSFLLFDCQVEPKMVGNTWKYTSFWPSEIQVVNKTDPGFLQASSRCFVHTQLQEEGMTRGDSLGNTESKHPS